jgi:hypothetical protein
MRQSLSVGAPSEKAGVPARRRRGASNTRLEWIAGRRMTDNANPTVIHPVASAGESRRHRENGNDSNLEAGTRAVDIQTDRGGFRRLLAVLCGGGDRGRRPLLPTLTFASQAQKTQFARFD